MAEHRVAIGVDVGGSAVKVGAVDVDTGDLIGERLRVDTPQPSTPRAVIAASAPLVHRAATDAGASGSVPVGVGVPAVVIEGVTKTAANIDKSWIDFEAQRAFVEKLGRPVIVLNDADAAGLAEMRFGAGRGRNGVVLVLTLGTGVGSGLFNDGRLVPNTELGHMEVRGRDAEDRSAAVVRVRDHLSWKQWAANLDEHLEAIDRILWPGVFILGGGVSQEADKFIPLLKVRPPVMAAELENDAGIVGAAMAAAEGSPEG